MKLKKRNNKIIGLELHNGKLIPEKGKLGQRDSVLFLCSKCFKEASRRVSLFDLSKPFTDRDFYCQQCNTKANNLDKYGVENVMQIKEIADKCARSFSDNNDIEVVIKKRKETCLRKYGDENFTNQEKREDTNLEKYGVKTLLDIKEIRDKRDIKKAYKNSKIAMMEKYGTEFPSQMNQKIKTLEKISNIEGFKLLTSIDEYINKFNKVELECEKCNTKFNRYVSNILYPTISINCPKCSPSGESQMERDLRAELDLLGVEYIANTRDIIKPYEIDIYIPSIKLGIELHGLYWHSEKFKDNNYHLNKFKLAKENKVELWQFYEDEWKKQKNIIMNKIRLKLGIYGKRIFGRKTEVKIINKAECDNILQYHLIGPDSSSIRLGLYYEKELVSAMTFKKEKTGYILNRYIVKADYVVLGGFSKLLKHFRKNFSYDFIDSFSENRYSFGDVYLKNGFEKIKEIRSDYWYVIQDERKHKFGFRKDAIRKKFQINDETLTEREMMSNLGFLRIYNAGLTKWRLI